MKVVKRLYFEDFEVLKDLVFKFIGDTKKCTNADLYKQFPTANRNTLRLYKREYHMIHGEFAEIAEDVKIIMDVLKYKTKQTVNLSKREVQAIENVQEYIEVKM